MVLAILALRVSWRTVSIVHLRASKQRPCDPTWMRKDRFGRRDLCAHPHADASRPRCTGIPLPGRAAWRRYDPARSGHTCSHMRPFWQRQSGTMKTSHRRNEWKVNPRCILLSAHWPSRGETSPDKPKVAVQCPRIRYLSPLTRSQTVSSVWSELRLARLPSGGDGLLGAGGRAQCPQEER